MPWWQSERVPVTFLAGYLGSGKTTLVNHLLSASGRRVAVLVNDVGAVNVDASLIAASDGATIELTDGCVCCSIATGLGPAFDILRDRAEAPEHVIVELSGVAEPARVTAWSKTPGFRYDAVVTLVDPDIEARDADPRLHDLVRAQIAAADLVVVTKADLDRSDARVDWLRSRTEAPIVISSGTPPVDVLLGVTGSPTAVPPIGDDPHRVVHLDDVDAASVDALWTGVIGDVVRAKGVVDIAGHRTLVQRVGNRITATDTDLAPTGLTVITLPSI